MNKEKRNYKQIKYFWKTKNPKFYSLNDLKSINFSKKTQDRFCFTGYEENKTIVYILELNKTNEKYFQIIIKDLFDEEIKMIIESLSKESLLEWLKEDMIRNFGFIEGK